MSSKYLNGENIARKVYDPSTEAIRTTSIATFAGGEIDLQISDTTDSIKVGDGTGDYLNINPDGSISVQIIPSGFIINEYNEVTNVASNFNTTILNYIAPSNCKLKHINIAGTNIAEYSVKVNSVTIDKLYTYFGNLNSKFDFVDGYDLITGQTVTVEVIHNRPDVGNFNARIQVAV